MHIFTFYVELLYPGRGLNLNWDVRRRPRHWLPEARVRLRLQRAVNIEREYLVIKFGLDKKLGSFGVNMKM